jgi:Flp pilus assembly pilin Flp
MTVSQMSDRCTKGNDMNLCSPSTPVGWLLLDVRARYERVRSGDLERGATALEWVIISAVLAALAIGVGTVIYNKVTEKSNQLDISRTPGT